MLFSIFTVFTYASALLYDPHVLFYIDIYAWSVGFIVILPFRDGSGEA